MSRQTNFIFSFSTLILCGLLTIISLSEWYIAKIQGQTVEYSFGVEGPTPYYYKTAEFYSTINLIWGIVFLSILLFTSLTFKNGQDKLTPKSLGTTLILILCFFINGQIVT